MQTLPTAPVWAITPYFSPSRFRWRRLNYERFRGSLSLPLVTADFSLEGAFELRSTDAHVDVQVNSSAPCCEVVQLFDQLHGVDADGSLRSNLPTSGSTPTGFGISSLLQPGCIPPTAFAPKCTNDMRRLIIVDLRDEFIEKDGALGLFVVLLQLFADAKYRNARVFDEAHKYIESPDLVAGLIEVVREMRHKGTSIMVASQDPPSVPISLIELSSQVILHKFNSPAWLEHIQKAKAALGSLTPEKMSNLRPGEAFIWSSKATDDAFTKSAVKIRCRPSVTHHGGATKTAVVGH